MQAAKAQVQSLATATEARLQSAFPRQQSFAPFKARSSASSQQLRQNILRHSIPVTGPGAGSPTGPGDTYSEEPPSIDAETAVVSQNIVATMQAKIKEALETDQVEIADAYGDGRHVSIDVISPLFEGKSSVARQRMVYKAIWFELQDLVHAVDAMTTKTPEEAAAS